ncbi:Protein CBR-INX-14 [Caenorhabditis briggsae]|uniref:Innexin n=1 Tax=Caenorhabditis briggsae TaxID=6238 RepID=A8XEL3_CAEBR|nr:Protein CBR-INX-14 [Caenorhabditis briggsae]CAP30981.2 Protein CBR-INX-14 [Caenorhabditis briggsae]
MIWEIPIIGDFITKPFKAAKLYEFYDRLHLFTVYLLGFFVLLTGAKQHFGNPIDCMLPKQHDELKSWREYIHNFCLFYGTFRYEVTNGTSSFGSYTADDASVNYYQWVPFFFAFQVCCFLLPFWCWAYMQKMIYIDMAFIVDYAGKINSEKTFEKTKEKVDRLVAYMNDHFRYRRAHKMGYFSWITFNSAFPSVLYSLTKFFFIANVVVQVNLVCKFLDVDSWMWGFDVRNSSKSSWSQHNVHLNSTLSPTNKNSPQSFRWCLQSIPLQESVNKFVNHKAQCIIPMNVINEKIFIGLYFWLLLLTGLSVIGTVKWIFRIRSRKANEVMIFKLIKKVLENEPHDSKMFDYRFNFVHDYLCADGILLIYFMMDTNGFLKTEEVIGALFRKYVSEAGALPPYEATIEDTYQVLLEEPDKAREILILHDTAGVSNYGPVELKKAYIQAADAFVLVYSSADYESFNRVDLLKKWIDRQFGKDKKEVPIVVLANMRDRPATVDSAFANSWAAREKVKLFEVSAKDRQSLVDFIHYVGHRHFHPTKESKFSLSKKLKSEKSSNPAILMDF